MKKTTKIMIAMIASGMIMIFATLGYIASTHSPNDDNDKPMSSSIDIEISGNSKTTQLAPFDEIAILDNMSSNTYYNLKGSCSVIVDSRLTEPQISYRDDWEHYMSVNVVNNRLEVAINFGIDNFYAINVDAQSAPVTITIPGKIKSITNDVFSNFEINGLISDNLLLTTPHGVLYNCKIQSMVIPNKVNTSLTLENSTIETVTFDSVNSFDEWSCSGNSFIRTIKAYGPTSYNIKSVNVENLNYNEFIFEPIDSTANLDISTKGAIKITPIKK